MAEYIRAKRKWWSSKDGEEYDIPVLIRLSAITHIEGPFPEPTHHKGTTVHLNYASYQVEEDFETMVEMLEAATSDIRENEK